VAAPSFEALFGRTADTVATAPGRVNLIGEHTDYSGGFVLPTAIPQRTAVELARRPDGEVRAFSAEMGGEPSRYRVGDEARSGGWLDYVMGVTSAAAAAGHRLGGFDLRLTSAVPLGSGLSSSAALEVALLRALREAFALDLDDVALALLGQRAECDFVGAPVGVMDQMASSLASPGEALLVDTRSLEHDRIALPPDVELVVLDSGVAHSHATGDYRTRRNEVDRAAELLGVPELRDVGRERWGAVEELPEPLRRRARHVVTENARVLEAARALRAGDAVRAGDVLRRGHASLRDDFEVSIPEIDLLVELAAADPAVFGARLTGGGFGGSIVALARRGAGAAVARAVAAAYAARTGRTPRVLVPEAD
jgi:galactokinase